MTNWTRRSLRVTAVMSLASMGVIAAAGPASAAPGSTSSSALNTGGVITAGPFAASSCDPATCPPNDADSFASADVPGLLTSGLLQTTATRTGATASVADLDADLSPLTALTASAVSSSCTVDPETGAVSGTSSIANGAITAFGSAPSTLQASAAPNTQVTVLDPAVASVVLNRQTTGPDGTLTVDAIYVTLLNSQTITVASSSCTPGTNPIPMGTGRGLLLGGGLLAVAGMGYLVTRRVVVARRPA